MMDSTGLLLIINAGSSSIKFAIFNAGEPPSAASLLCEGQMSGIGHAILFHVSGAQLQMQTDVHLPEGCDHAAALDVLLRWIKQTYANQHIVAAGHRIVHGGDKYQQPVRIDAAVLDELRRLIPLAPLHQPHHIAAITALQNLFPDLLQIACFDTAFHHTNASVATSYALPQEFTDEGIRRYGFHGLSYEYIAGVMPSVMGNLLAQGRVVVAHLGSGASMCAILNGVSVASTMGFTALDGLPMSRRCGTLDPGVVLYLMQEKKMSADQVAHFLYNDCGLQGVSGISDDVRVLLASDDPRATAAIDLFAYRISRELGSLAAALGGLDALIFTAGIGENAAVVRNKVGVLSAWLGVRINETIASGQHAVCLSAADATVATWVIPTNEDLMIAQHTHRLFLSR